MAGDTNTSITTEDIIALAGIKPKGAVDFASGGRSAGYTDAAANLDAALGVKLPEYQTSPELQAAQVKQIQANQAVQDTAKNAIVEFDKSNDFKGDITANIVNLTRDAGAAKGTVTESLQQIADRNEAIRTGNLQDTNVVMYELDKQRLATDKELAEKTAALAELQRDDSFTGWFKQVLFEGGMIRDVNRAVAHHNTLSSVQTELLASEEEHASNMIAQLPNFTPEQREAEAKLARIATDTLITKTINERETDKVAHYSRLVDARRADAAAAGATVAAITAEDYKVFDSHVNAVMAAKDNAAASFNLEKAIEASDAKSPLFYQEYEDVFNLPKGGGKTHFTNLKATNKRAAAQALEIVSSGAPSDRFAAAQATANMRPNQANQQQLLTAKAVLKKLPLFTEFVANKAAKMGVPVGTDMTAFEKLPLPIQQSVQDAFFNSPAGYIEPPFVDANTQALTAQIPTEPIVIPAILGKDDKVIKEAKVIRMKPTGALGLQLAEITNNNLRDALTVTAAGQITIDGRDVADVAKEYHAFVNNYVNAYNATNGVQRRRSGLPPLTELLVQLELPAMMYGTVPDTINVLNYPEVLATLSSLKTATLMQSAAESFGIGGSLPAMPAGTTNTLTK